MTTRGEQWPALKGNDWKIKKKEPKSWNLERLQHDVAGKKGSGHNEVPSSTGLHWDSSICITAKGNQWKRGPLLGLSAEAGATSLKPPRVKSAYLGCHLDMTGPQGQGRRVKLLTTLNVTMAILYYERHAKRTYIEQFHSGQQYNTHPTFTSTQKLLCLVFTAPSPHNAGFQKDSFPAADDSKIFL